MEEFSLDGILNINKEKGFTSHDVVAVVRKILHMKKVGHTGTLDPDAQGVLPICVGRGTKLSDIIMDGQKSYRTILYLGKTTTTEDASGEVIEEKPVVFDEDKIRQVISSFIGEIEQIPPMYSAIKINGKKLYELAREGKEIERKSRKITIFDIHICNFLPPNRVEIEVDCSKGTYIRTLCADIGRDLGCGGHMEELLRTATGGFLLENAITLGELKTLAEKEELTSVLATLEDALKKFPCIIIAEESTKLLYNGGAIKEDYFIQAPEILEEGQIVQAFDFENNLIGLYRITEDEGFFIKPFKMLI